MNKLENNHIIKNNFDLFPTTKEKKYITFDAISEWAKELEESHEKRAAFEMSPKKVEDAVQCYDYFYSTLGILNPKSQNSSLSIRSKQFKSLKPLQNEDYQKIKAEKRELFNELIEKMKNEKVKMKKSGSTKRLFFLLHFTFLCC